LQNKLGKIQTFKTSDRINSLNFLEYALHLWESKAPAAVQSSPLIWNKWQLPPSPDFDLSV